MRKDLLIFRDEKQILFAVECVDMYLEVSAKKDKETKHFIPWLVLLFNQSHRCDLISAFRQYYFTLKPNVMHRCLCRVMVVWFRRFSVSV